MCLFAFWSNLHRFLGRPAVAVGVPKFWFAQTPITSKVDQIQHPKTAFLGWPYGTRSYSFGFFFNVNPVYELGDAPPHSEHLHQNCSSTRKQPRGLLIGPLVHPNSGSLSHWYPGEILMGSHHAQFIASLLGYPLAYPTNTLVSSQSIIRIKHVSCFMPSLRKDLTPSKSIKSILTK